LDLGRALALSVRFFEANDANPTGCYAATLLSSAAAVTKAGVQVASRRRSHGLQISQRHPDRWEAFHSCKPLRQLFWQSDGADSAHILRPKREFENIPSL